MPAAIPFIGPAIGAIGSIFGAKKSPQTQTTNSTSTINQSNRPYYSPEQEAMNAMLGRVLRKMGKKPQVDPALRIQGRNQINDVYDQMNNRLDTTMVARGFGESGKHNLNTLGLNLERGKSMGSLESDLYNQAIQRQMQALGLATTFAQPHGSDTTGTQTGTQTTTGGGNTWGQAAIGGLGASLPGMGDDISTSLWLRKMLGQGTSPGFGSAPGLGGVPDPYANPYGDGGN